MSGQRLEGRVAIVTGATRGIGEAIAERMARDGAIVVVVGREAAAAQGVASRLPGSSPAVCDVADEGQVVACVADAITRHGRIDIVVNNAGAMSFKPMAEWTKVDWLEILEIDLVGAALFTREAFRHMGPEGGAIVNVASVHADRTTANVAPYAAAKAGVLSLTRSAAIEGRPRKIRANAVLPGAIDTGMLWSNPNLKSGAEVIAPEDVGKPMDIADAVAFLASDDARFITGATLAVDGGRLARL